MVVCLLRRAAVWYLNVIYSTGLIWGSHNFAVETPDGNLKWVEIIDLVFSENSFMIL